VVQSAGEKRGGKMKTRKGVSSRHRPMPDEPCLREAPAAKAEKWLFDKFLKSKYLYLL
jgi:hypothetical protein